MPNRVTVLVLVSLTLSANRLGADEKAHATEALLESVARYMEQGRPHEAVRLLQDTLKDDPANITVRVALAAWYTDAEEYGDVVALLDASPGIEETPPALALLGDAYCHLEQLADARRCFTKAVQLNDRSADLRRKLGDLYLREGKFALALEQLRAAVDLGATGGEVRLGLAVAYLRLGNLFGETRIVRAPARTAGEICHDAYLIEPVDGTSGEFLAAPPDSAIYQTQRALDEGLDTIEVHLTRAQIWSQARRYRRAADVYATLAPRLATSALSPQGQADVYWAYAQALYGADDMEGYIEQLPHAVRLDKARFGPSLAQGYERAAERYNQRGDLAGYIRYLELAVGEAPNVAEWHYRLGNGYWEAGRQRPATREWQITLQIAPDHADGARMLELIQRVQAPPR